MIIPHAAWWRAIQQALPGANPISFVGHSGALADLAVCAPGCDCRLRHAFNRSIAVGLAKLGLRALILNPESADPDHVARRVSAATDRKRPVVWVSRDSAGVIAAGPDSRGGFTLQLATARPGIDSVGDWEEVRLTLETLLRGELYGLRRDPAPRGTLRHRNLVTLLEWSASAYRPPTHGGCITGGPFQEYAEGLAAYGQWEAAATHESGEAAAARARLWSQGRLESAEFLRSLSRNYHDRASNRLRSAADLCEEEARLFLRAVSIPGVIRDAEQVSEEATQSIMEAALLRSGLPTMAQRTLMEPWTASLHGVGLNEVLYLARAGTRPLRELAALRLAGASDSAAASSTLQQLLYDEDGRVASTALWALWGFRSDRLGRQLLNAARHGARHRTALDYPFSQTLLAGALTWDAASVDAVLAMRDDIATNDSDSPLVGDIDLVLSAHSSGAQGQAGRSGGERPEE